MMMIDADEDDGDDNDDVDDDVVDAEMLTKTG